ncbi:phospholipase D-like domain-containing protein [Aurantimonas sp. A3-2-R12]|uniref:phospholipase D-like domain-containing protein n=1 Tax=Aurantimonas sp. A3-2-R12 TaxID=3114362 RepID=UPI002E16ECB5|nr:phospholipase D-like domain-containing protein [Aurantimonas sp. A3-2-R12]
MAYTMPLGGGIHRISSRFGGAFRLYAQPTFASGQLLLRTRIEFGQASQDPDGTERTFANEAAEGDRWTMRPRNGRTTPIAQTRPLTRGSLARQVEIERERSTICVPELREGRGTFLLFVEGDELYDVMIKAIESAERDICMESYIFAADEVGQRFADALAAKARSGVHVRLHLDAFGAGYRTFHDLERNLEGAGVRLRWFHSFNLYRPLRYLQRNHRKLLVVDGRESFRSCPGAWCS